MPEKSQNDAELPVIFDRSVLVGHTMEDGPLQQEVLDLFAAQLRTLIARLGEGRIPAEEAKFMAHSLRGAAAAVGALRIQELAENWQENPSQLTGIKARLSLAAEEFLALLEQKTL